MLNKYPKLDLISSVRRLRDGANETKRVRDLEEQLPDTLRYLAMSIRASVSLRRAVAEAAAKADKPIKTELDTATWELKAGLPLEDVMRGFAERAKSREFRAAATIISIGGRYGGDLTAALEALAAVTEQRLMVRREAAALTAQARLSAIVLSVLPVGFFVLSPAGGARQALAKPAGWVVIAAGLALNMAGLFVMRRLAAPERLC